MNKALILYLENQVVEIARSLKRYLVLTKNAYRNTVMKESQIAAMEEFIENVKILLGALGFKVLEPLDKPDKSKNGTSGKEQTEEIRLHLERTIKDVGKIEAEGIRTSEGFVVLKGSHISPVDDNTISTALKEQRKKASIESGILKEDVLLSSPSYVAMFVIGKSANGLTS